jgi:hypothetical protein
MNQPTPSSVPLHRFDARIGSKTGGDRAAWNVINANLNPDHPFALNTRVPLDPASISDSNTSGSRKLLPSSVLDYSRPSSVPSESAFLYEHNMLPQQASFDASLNITIDTSTRNMSFESPYNFRIRFGPSSGSESAIQIPNRLESVAAVVFTEIRIPVRCVADQRSESHAILRIAELGQENQVYSNPKYNASTDILLHVSHIDSEFAHLRCANSIEWSYNRPSFGTWTCTFLWPNGQPMVVRSDVTEPDRPETWAIVTSENLDHAFTSNHCSESWFHDMAECQHHVADAIGKWSSLSEEDRCHMRPLIHRLKKGYRKSRLREVDPKDGANNTHMSFRVIGSMARPIQTMQKR